MVIHLLKKPLSIVFVLRHRFEKGKDIMDKFEWHRWELGIWFKNYKAMTNKWQPKNYFMIGINLFILKFWLTITNKEILILEINDEENK